MRVCIVTIIPITHCPRPRKLARTLATLGCDVTLLEPDPGSNPVPPNMRAITYRRGPDGLVWHRIVKHWAPVARRMNLVDVPSAYRHSMQPPGLAQIQIPRRFDHFVSVDISTLPLIAAWARENDASFGFDAREFHPHQHDESATWRALYSSLIDELLDEFLERALWLTTVSDGIADLLCKRYALEVRPTVIRSYSDADTGWIVERPPNDRIEVLFHGDVKPDRNVHGLIESSRKWPEGFDLTIRGRGVGKRYSRGLRRSIRRSTGPARIRWEDPVSPRDVVTAAATADIGVLPWPTRSLQKRYAAPNKLYEYIAAGLAVAASTPSEAADLVETNEIGFTYDPCDVDALGVALRELDRDRLARWQRKSRELGRTVMNWPTEEKRLAEFLRRALGL